MKKPQDRIYLVVDCPDALLEQTEYKIVYIGNDLDKAWEIIKIEEQSGYPRNLKIFKEL